MKAKLNKDFIIFIYEKNHYKVKNGQSTTNLPKGLVKQMKNSGLIEEVKDGITNRK